MIIKTIGNRRQRLFLDRTLWGPMFTSKPRAPRVFRRVSAQIRQYTGCASDLSMQGICALEGYFNDSEVVAVTEAVGVLAQAQRQHCDEIIVSLSEAVDDALIESCCEARELQNLALQSAVRW